MEESLCLSVFFIFSTTAHPIEFDLGCCVAKEVSALALKFECIIGLSRKSTGRGSFLHYKLQTTLAVAMEKAMNELRHHLMTSLIASSKVTLQLDGHCTGPTNRLVNL